MKRAVTLLFLILSVLSLRAQICYPAKDGWFRYAPYGHSLYADVHPNFIRLEIASLTNNPVYDYGKTGLGSRTELFGNFAADIPIWNRNFGGGRFGISITETLSANLWMDVFEKSTSPVINTDYRISCPTTTFIHRQGKRFLKNYSVSFTPYKHESTHIGDELISHNMDEHYALHRVNVSYNYAELNFTLNEPENRYEPCHTFRFGLMLRYKFFKGWYSVEERDGDIGQVPGQDVEFEPSGYFRAWGPDDKLAEAFLQYQYQTRTSKHGFQGVFSAEIRNRVVYGYDLLAPEGSFPTDVRRDSRCFTYNAFAGIRYNVKGYDGYFSRFSIGLRAYHGNCPYGQFRSIRNYSQLGLCVIFQ